MSGALGVLNTPHAVSGLSNNSHN